MNLIEQLGGYEYTKQSSCAWFFRYGLNWQQMKQLELLQYRREHGIYEAGDCVIIDGHEDVYQIQYVYEGAWGYGMWQGRRFSHSMIERHATDAEIKANKRLD